MYIINRHNFQLGRPWHHLLVCSSVYKFIIYTTTTLIPPDKKVLMVNFSACFDASLSFREDFICKTRLLVQC